jgi:hypothetical protein
MNQLRILVADDSQTLCAAYREILEPEKIYWLAARRLTA